MMREIKCRGRDERGKWHHGYYVDGYMFDSMTGQAETVPFIVKAQLQGHERVVSETVGQFTGITDVYGNDIYEGDIVHMYSVMPGCDIDEIGIVKFIECAFLFEKTDGSNGWSIFNEATEIKVIGNIYENSELLKN